MGQSMDKRMTKASWKRDLFATIVFIGFVAISVAMISLTTMLFMNLTGAIDALMKEAKTPDYLQMHTGEIDIEEIEQFTSKQNGITDYQILPFLNLDNSILSIGGESLLDSTQDNGISVQGDGFDYMLNEKNEMPKIENGQVYVPICYESIYHVTPGDVMKIGKEELVVVGFIRDSQMNSMMASSKRFLVTKEDYEKLRPLGSEEYLIEFLLDEGIDTNVFQTAYESCHLPMNGPTITGPLIKMMNTLSDGIMIFIILFISLLVLGISLVCIRFMLITRVITEADEVGMLKALGISKRDIRKIFIERYKGLILAGAVLGMLISIGMFLPLSAQMQKLYGVSGNHILNIMITIAGTGFIAGIIYFFVARVLRKLNDMTPVKTLTGSMKENKKRSNKMCIVFVSALCIFLMMIPLSLYTTLSSENFVTYMGIGKAQFRMDLRESDESEEQFKKIQKMMENDTAIKHYACYQTASTPVMLPNQTAMNILLEYGDHTRFPVAYHEGDAPSGENEIALSYLLAKELELATGDNILVKQASGYEKCVITGIYSDITNGGKTAKLYVKEWNHMDNVMWRITYATLKSLENKQEFVDKYTDAGMEVVDIHSRVIGTYGPTLTQIRRADICVKLIASIISLLVITLFVRMMIANERNEIAIKKALGFTCLDIQKNYWKTGAVYVLAGVFLGLIGSVTLGESICGMALESLGAVGFDFVFTVPSIGINLLLGGLICFLAIYIGSNGITQIRSVECCMGKE